MNKVCDLIIFVFVDVGSLPRSKHVEYARKVSDRLPKRNGVDYFVFPSDHDDIKVVPVKCYLGGSVPETPDNIKDLIYELRVHTTNVGKAPECAELLKAMNLECDFDSYGGLFYINTVGKPDQVTVVNVAQHQIGETVWSRLIDVLYEAKLDKYSWYYGYIVCQECHNEDRDEKDEKCASCGGIGYVWKCNTNLDDIDFEQLIFPMIVKWEETDLLQFGRAIIELYEDLSISVTNIGGGKSSLVLRNGKGKRFKSIDEWRETTKG